MSENVGVLKGREVKTRELDEGENEQDIKIGVRQI